MYCNTTMLIIKKIYYFKTAQTKDFIQKNYLTLKLYI